MAATITVEAATRNSRRAGCKETIIP